MDIMCSWIPIRKILTDGLCCAPILTPAQWPAQQGKAEGVDGSWLGSSENSGNLFISVSFSKGPVN